MSAELRIVALATCFVLGFALGRITSTRRPEPRLELPPRRRARPN